MRTPGQLVRRFHEIAGLVIRDRHVEDLPADEKELRRALLKEEHDELFDATYGYDRPDGGGWVDPDVIEVADALADMVVILYGTAEHWGIDLDRAVEIVMETNFRKVPDCRDCVDGRVHYSSTVNGGTIFSSRECAICGGTGKGEPLRREDGKILKPEGWVPPDLRAALR